MKVQSRYLEKYEAVAVNLSKIRAEYNQVANQLQDVTATGNKVLVQQKYSILKLGEWTKDKELFPYTLEIADKVKEFFNYNSITYRSIQPNTVYNWHKDPGQICYHIPIITNPGCFFIYEDRCFRMPADGSLYFVNNSRNHTFANAGLNPRVHLTFEILE